VELPASNPKVRVGLLFKEKNQVLTNTVRFQKPYAAKTLIASAFI
jgi:hypothetical protein